ncbi:anaerobic carbon-monoxide dehydrogenase catalytic subunit [Eubacterium barkeri]|uniref:Carbon monoxide dehydrogenase n=1 Tax=Eubacterium barkeri TaxID=1528 RepID=A0A1H3I6M0_EUBBA|nr:anaerobic carbon-monoxide dehydrogenase catalytic subunit [Eubacterium barkeri]SDY23340.1 carbon-monoxide dehydrogenase catalytic subunit [Eubacterium barkeri]
MGVTQCEMCRNADGCLEQFLGESGRRVSHHRMVDQEVKCGFGLAGVCCKLCSNGPCRISKNRPYGVCGADADTIVMRNFLRSVAAGSGCYIHVVENAAKRLKEAVQAGRTLKGPETLHRLCGQLGISAAEDGDAALILAETILTDLRRPYDEQMVVLEKLATPLRLTKWRELGILPGGGKDEIFNALVKTSTNLNSDPVDMAMQCLRLGISTGLYGLVLTNLLNDIILGEPELGFEATGLGIIDPDCVNIMITGHQQAMFGDLIQQLEQPEIQAKAAMVGAKAIKIVGCTCVGQDLQLRHNHCGTAFSGHAGNNYTSEAVLLTGCVDVVVSEFNCTLPGIEPICTDLDIPMLCLDDVAKKAGARGLHYSEASREAITMEILSTAIVAYAKRVGDQKRINPMAGHGAQDVITGVTDLTLKKALGGSWQPVLDAIVAGQIKGVAAVVGCSNLRAGGHDVFTIELTKRLIASDILVLSAGCTSGGLANSGLMSPAASTQAGPGLKAVCEALGVPPVLNFGPCLAIGRIEMVAGELAAALGVDLPQLPVVVSAPQWLEEQALADGAFALTLGFPLHLGLAPFVTGSDTAVTLFTETMKDLTGGYLFIDEDVDSTAAAFEAIIAEKRKGLGLDG